MSDTAIIITSETPEFSLTGQKKNARIPAGKELSGVYSLTPRQKEICIFFVKNPELRVKEIAEKMGISENTLWNHLTEIRQIMGVKVKGKGPFLDAIEKNYAFFGIEPRPVLPPGAPQAKIDFAPPEKAICKIIAQDPWTPVKQIAARLNRSGPTIRNSLTNIYNKVNIPAKMHGKRIKLAEILGQYPEFLENDDQNNSAKRDVSPKQQKIITAVCTAPDKSLKEIAKTFFMRRQTLGNILTAIYQKKGARNRNHLAEIMRFENQCDLQDLDKAVDEYAKSYGLSTAEKRVFMALVSSPSYSNKEIARELALSGRTVSNTLISIFDKTNERRRGKLVNSFMRYAAARAPANPLDDADPGTAPS